MPRTPQPDDDLIVRALIAIIGEDPTRGGLVETPRRVLEAWKYWAGGYDVDVQALLKCFEDGSEKYDEMIIVSNISFHSHCEHHLAPFFGVAHVGYLPNKRIVGLSKLARVVDAYARRLQVQERMTQQIANALYAGGERGVVDQMTGFAPRGVGVIVEARHLCMESRGVTKSGAITTTSALLGVMKESGAREEFLALARQRSTGVK